MVGATPSGIQTQVHFDKTDGSRANRNGLIVVSITLAVWIGVIAYYAPALRLSHINQRLENLFGLLLLLGVCAALALLSLVQLVRLLFEASAISFEESVVTVTYWNLGTKSFKRPFNGCIRRNVRLASPGMKGYRAAHVIYRGLHCRIVIPAEHPDAETVVSALVNAHDI